MRGAEGHLWRRKCSWGQNGLFRDGRVGVCLRVGMGLRLNLRLGLGVCLRLATGLRVGVCRQHLFGLVRRRRGGAGGQVAVDGQRCGLRFPGATGAQLRGGLAQHARGRRALRLKLTFVHGHPSGLRRERRQDGGREVLCA